jgi:tetratricopeptide (TPR) repeat protein
LQIHEKLNGATSLNAAFALNRLGDAKSHLGLLQEAEPLLQKSLQIRESSLSNQHPHRALSLHSLAILRDRQQRPAEAEICFQSAIAVREASLPPEHPHLADLCEDYANFLAKNSRLDNAQQFMARANSAREKHAADELFFEQ